MRRTRLRNARPKYPFGSEEAAMLAAAAINVAGTLSAASINKKATESAAEEQAKAITQNATTTSKMISDQTANNKALMEKQIETTNKIHEDDKNAQRDLQMQLQLMQGNENLAERERASNIQLKRGGRIRRTGVAPFKITDGGGAKLTMITPEGYPVYEFYGNDHNHYHKTRGGKYKSGVGVKLASGKTVEAEGNQHSSTGELLYVSPEGYDFISKHKMGGIAPADLVREGVHPEEAFAYQELYKGANNIADDGSKAKSGKRCKRLAGGNGMIGMNDGSNSNLIPNYTTAGGAMFTYLQNQEDQAAINDKITGNMFEGREKSKYGKRCSLKLGGRPKYGNGSFDWGHFGASAGSALANSLGNLGGYFITAAGNRNAAGILSDAYEERAKILTDAYSRMTGIDPSIINTEAYQPAYAMAALESPRVYVGSQLAAAERDAAAERKAIGEGTMSSAARLARLNRSNVRLADKRNTIYDAQANQEGERSSRNANRLTETSQFNAMAAMRARRDLASANFELAKYNNEINNMKIAGIAEAQAGALSDAAEVRGTALTANAGLLGSTIQSIGKDTSTLLNDYVSRRFKEKETYFGADMANKVQYVLNHNDINKAQALYDSLADRTDTEAEAWKRALAKKYNFIGDQYFSEKVSRAGYMKGNIGSENPRNTLKYSKPNFPVPSRVFS